MNRPLLLITTLLFALTAAAQRSTRSAAGGTSVDVTRYRVTLHQDSRMASRLSDIWQQKEMAASTEQQRGFFNNTYDVLKTQSLGLLSSSVTSVLTLGAGAVMELFKSNKADWRKMVQQENSFVKEISTIESVNDFYDRVSTSSAMDPSGMTFNGFSCVQMRGNDTVLYVSCHLKDTDEALQRIIHHSKFELQLDTLVFRPYLCDLPNDSTRSFSQRTPTFSFSQRRNLNLRLQTQITSSWINQAIQVYQNQLLGEFAVNVPISEKELEADSVFRYVSGRSTNKVKDIQMIGDCFIVPRSYIGVRDADGNYLDVWGTGQYHVKMKLMETCNITPAFESNWKADWKARKRSARNPSPVTQIWTTVKQTLADNGKQCILSVIEAPTNYALEEVVGPLPTTGQAGAKAAGAAKASGQQRK